MLKNKTHRIISISPTSQHTSLKASHNNQTGLNKTVTPIKQIQHTTRANTIKSILKPQECQIIESTLKKQQIENQQNNVIESIVVSAYKGLQKDNRGIRQKYFQDKIRNQKAQRTQKNQNQDKQGRKSCKQRSSFNLDELLNKIGKNYENQKNNASIQLIKKTQISCLRQILRQAKSIVNMQDTFPQINPSSSQSPPSSNIQSLSSHLRQQISIFFSNLHKQLYHKQKTIYQQLQQKVLQLKQKNITKYYQTINLKSYIDKCQIDINSNYEKIINELDLEQFNKIVQSYKNKLEYYMEKIKVMDRVKFNTGGIGQLGLDSITVILCKQQEQQIIQPNTQKCNTLVQQSPSITIQKITKLPINKESYRKSHQKHTYAKSTLQQLQNIPFSKFLPKPQRNYLQIEPRIASARGKY